MVEEVNSREIGRETCHLGRTIRRRRETDKNRKRKIEKEK